MADVDDVDRHQSFSAQTRPWLFLAITLGLTWLFGFAAVILQDRLPDALVLVLAYGGGLAPVTVAASLAWRHGRAFRRDFWQRIVDWRRIGWRWLAVILLFFPLKTILAGAIDVALGGWGIEAEGLTRLVAQPAFVVPTLIFWLFFGPVPEEPGWRGYALDGLQNRFGPLTSSAVVGVAWMAWHLPLFFLPGTWQAQHLGLGTLLFWLWVVNLIVESVLYTWIYNNTGRSILAAILFHFVGNAFGELFAMSASAEVASTVLSVVAALLVVRRWRVGAPARRRAGTG
jgi:membrane protease YdiL (CAAX protease family)